MAQLCFTQSISHVRSHSHIYSSCFITFLIYGDHTNTCTWIKNTFPSYIFNSEVGWNCCVDASLKRSVNLPCPPHHLNLKLNEEDWLPTSPWSIKYNANAPSVLLMKLACLCRLDRKFPWHLCSIFKDTDNWFFLFLFFFFFRGFTRVSNSSTHTH